MINRWKLTLEYDGSEFSGWQRQEPGVRTVQQTVENAIASFSSQKITLHVAGRTDAGVHARGQVAHVDLDLPEKYTGFHILKAINAHLRMEPVVVVDVASAPVHFHARFSATNKLYTYRVINRPGVLAIDKNRAWVVHRPLNIDAMRAGAGHLCGHHDFTSFRDTACQAKSPVKTLDRFDIVVLPYDSSGGIEILFHIEGRSFLHHQVRNMVGTLVQVGLGRFSPDDIRNMLAAKNRAAAGVTAPPDGLYLVRVDYGTINI